MDRSRGGSTSKLHAVVDANGLPLRLGQSPDEAHDNRLCPVPLAGLLPKIMVLADRGYDADWTGALVNEQRAGPTFRPSAIAATPFASALTFIGRATVLSSFQQDQALPTDRDPL